MPGMGEKKIGKGNKKPNKAHKTLEGKPQEEGSMPSSVVMSLEAGQVSGLLPMSAK